MANYLGLTESIRSSIVRAILGFGNTISIPSSSKAYLTISSTDPAVSLTEPSTEDSNYKRYELSSKEISVTGATAKCIDEIK